VNALDLRDQFLPAAIYSANLQIRDELGIAHGTLSGRWPYVRLPQIPVILTSTDIVCLVDSPVPVHDLFSNPTCLDFSCAMLAIMADPDPRAVLVRLAAAHKTHKDTDNFLCHA
jgi:hypothetical protein